MALRTWAHRRRVLTWTLTGPLLVGCALGTSSCAAPVGSSGSTRTTPIQVREVSGGSHGSPRAARRPPLAPHPSLPTGIRPGVATDATRLPPLPSTLVSSIDNLGNGMSLASAASERAVVPLPRALSAVLAEEGARSVAKAAQLVTLDSAQSPNGVLAWAIWVVPEGGYFPITGPVPIPGSTVTTPTTLVQNNYEVDFVDATTGRWLQAIQSYDPALSSSTDGASRSATS